MKIFVDFDGVLADLSTTWFEILNHRWRARGEYEDPKAQRGWDGMVDMYPELSDEQVKAPLYTEDLYDSVRPLPEAVEAFKELQDRFGALNVFVISACVSPNMVRSKLKWMERYDIGYGYGYGPTDMPENLILTRNKSMIGHEDDWLIDDGLHNLDYSPCNTILITAPHNLEPGAGRTVPVHTHLRKDSLAEATLWLMDQPIEGNAGGGP